jgi:hypothetical protein
MPPLTIDGVFGAGTESGLVEAFGGDEWRTMEVTALTERLTQAEPAAGRRGQHNLRFGEMFKDGLLDMTLGIGFDEGGNHRNTITGFQEALTARGFTRNTAEGIRLLQQAGRPLTEDAFGVFFVRPNALQYHPPAGRERNIDAVVRLVYNRDAATGGGAAARAFSEGMASSDVAYYSGHGRYGSGPDFDRNFRGFNVTDSTGRRRFLTEYEELERVMRREGRSSGRSAWQQFLWMQSRGLVEVLSSNEGNVFINPQDLHSEEFGARLIYWDLQRRGINPVTGTGGPLASAAAANPERRYRVLVFDGCRTRDYVRSIRNTAGYDARSADILATRRTVDWGDEVRTLAAFLDSIIGQHSAEQMVRDMDRQQGVAEGGPIGGAYGLEGMGDNPVIR